MRVYVDTCIHHTEGAATPVIMTVETARQASPRSRKILVVTADSHLRNLLQLYLSEKGFFVLIARNGKEMHNVWQRGHFDLLILDLMLPDNDGLAICRGLRSAHDDTPIIMLTAKAAQTDRIVGLEMGADDFLSAPINPRELLARINALLRRYTPARHPSAPNHGYERITFGPYTLNLSTRSLMRGDEAIPMTTSEFSTLKAFARNARIPLSRDKLMELTRGREYKAFDRSLDVQISRLRKRIEPDPSKPTFIQTVWGIGYVFIPDSH